MKKNQRYLFYLITMGIIAIAVIGALIWFVLVNLNSQNSPLETIAFSSTVSESEFKTSETSKEIKTTEETQAENTSQSLETESSTLAASEEVTAQITEASTEEIVEELPHDRTGVWISYSHSKENSAKKQTLLFSEEEGKLPLRLYQNEIETITIYNDTKEDVDLYFYIYQGMQYLENELPSESTEIKDFCYEVKVTSGSSKQFTLTNDENCTVTYALAYKSDDKSEIYVTDQNAMAYMNGLVIPDYCIYHISGNKNSYSEELLQELPYCVIEWKENDAYETMALLCNVVSFNGIDLQEQYQVGGANHLSFQEFAILPSQNPWTEETLRFEKQGNVYALRIPYSISQDNLYQAKVTFSFDGSVEFYGEGRNANGTFNLMKTWYCKLTDQNGASHIYKIVPDRDKHGIPVVYITTEKGKNITSKNNYLAATFMMDAEHVEGVSSIPLQVIGIKGRGHSTWKKAKKPYAIKFTEKVSIMGLEKNKDWVLLANYFDPSNSRNYIAYEMAKELDFDFTPSSYPVDVFLNGVYIGVYCIGEKIEVASSRVDLNDNNGTIDTDYLIEIGAFESGQFTVGNMKGITITYPKSTEITKEQRNYVIQYLNAAHQAVINGGNYEDYIDMDSFLDWFIMIELTYNCDSSFNRSVYITKKAGGKLEFQPVWDFDLGFGNLCILTPEYETWATTQNGFTEITWATYLLKDEHFRNLLEKRWIQVRDQLLARGLAACDQMSEWMNAGSGKENFDLWVTPGERIGWEWDFVMDYTTTEEHIDYLRRFLNMRKAYLDRIIVDREEPTTYIKPKETEAVIQTEAQAPTEATVETKGVEETEASAETAEITQAQEMSEDKEEIS